MQATEGSGVVPSSGRRLPGIEGLRALAACSILVFHTWRYAAPPGGRSDVGPLHHVLPDLTFGVTLFFSLSGFLLYRPFAAALLREGRVAGVSRYLRNRALRILPAYWVILLLCALVLQSVLTREGARLSNGAMFDLELLAKNLLLVQNYGPESVVTGIGPTWSLAVEAVFYLALPLLVLVTARFVRGASSRAGRRWVVLAPAGALLLLGLSGKAAAAWIFPGERPFAGYDPTWHAVLERSFWCQADLFAFGMALAVLHVEWEDGRIRLARGWRVLAGSAALACYLVTALMTGTREQLSYSPFNTLMALAFALVLAVVVLTPSTTRPALVRVLDSRPLISLGLVSYSIFLWHEPLARWVASHDLGSSGTDGFFVNVAVVAGLTFTLSSVTYLLVERPALRLKLPTGARSPRTGPADRGRSGPRSGDRRRPGESAP